MEPAARNREQLAELERDLRAALSNGCPEWLVKAAHRCVIELERLQMYDAPEAATLGICKQAELLIQFCRDASSKRSLAC